MDEETRKVMQAGFDTLAALIRGTNSELASTREELSQKIDATNVRLDATNVRLDATNERLDAANGRLDNLIGIAGSATRSLREDVDALAVRVEELERKVS